MKHLISIFCILFSLSLQAQFIPQSKKITNTFFPDTDEVLNTTPALQKKKGFTDYKELMRYLNTLVERHPENISLSIIGESQKGKQIPMLTLSVPNGKDKVKVFMQGGLHGNEPASTESMLYLMDRLLNDNTYKKLLNTIELAIIPMANIDGFIKNNRYAANGLDLNRDQTKLMAPESVALKQAFSDFNPHVAVDFHEYRPYRRDFARMGSFGVANMYDAMFLYSGNLNIPENLRNLTNDLFVQNARTALDKYNYTHYPYISTLKVDGEIHINQGSISSRSSASNYGLTNTIASLIEIRGVGLGKTSFKRRIHSSFLIAIAYLKTASENIELVKSEITKAVNQTNDIVVEQKRGIYTNQIKFIDIDAIAYTDLDMTIRDAWKARPVFKRKRPKAYIIEADQNEIIDKLKVLGADIDYLDEEKEYVVQCYHIDSRFEKQIRYEKMKLQTVEISLQEKKKIFPKGTAVIKMNQRRANLIAEVMEPEAPNSFVSFGVLKTEKGKILPIYRLLN